MPGITCTSDGSKWRWELLIGVTGRNSFSSTGRGRIAGNDREELLRGRGGSQGDRWPSAPEEHKETRGLRAPERRRRRRRRWSSAHLQCPIDRIARSERKEEGGEEE